ncbi:hypothetical protein [Leuconostoc mesenteroides]|uniref:hypothetical protein n=1 Tax=Leuconostoc mesenteroides TaxID=1245 RepID=UPI00374A4F41
MGLQILLDVIRTDKGKTDPEICWLRSLELAPNQVIGLEDSVAGIESINSAGQISLAIGDAVVLSAANLIFSSAVDVTLQSIQSKMDKIKSN